MTLVALVEDQVVAVRSGVAELMDDLGAVHDARVALRRLRATLSVFAPVLEDVPEGLVADLRWFAREVSGTRDAEVVAARLEDPLADAADRAAVAVIENHLAVRADAAIASARAALVHPRIDSLVSGLGRLHLTVPTAAEIYLEVRSQLLVVETLEDLCVSLPAAVATERAAERSNRRRVRAFHDERKRVKTARAVTSVLDVPTEDRSRLNKSLRQVQELLGEHHDAAVTRSWIGAVAQHEPSTKELAKEIRSNERAEMRTVEEQAPWAVDRLVKRVHRIGRTPAVHPTSS